MTDRENPPKSATDSMFEKYGEDFVRAKIDSGQWKGTTELHARKWLTKVERERAFAKEYAEADRTGKSLLLAGRATDAAERAAEASEKAAEAAERSANFTRAAAWGSAIAAVAALIAAVWPKG